ncbi:MAG: DUF1501 domain-containing protein [Armatimonadetes bacterium]|nr:DUF1501 domain-containing protein [Armatimonadota bacterium]
MQSRRLFLRNGGIALASVGLVPALGPAFLRRAALGAETPKRGKVLICLFQRGACDGLSMVTPHGDPDLYKLRSQIAVARPKGGDRESATLDLDGFFGLHPAMAALMPMYKSGQMAIVHAAGSPSGTRSHFDAQDFMESGTPDAKSVPDGWLSRTAALCPEDRANAKNTPFKAVALGGAMPRSLQGDANALAIPDLRSFGIRDNAGAKSGRGNNDAAMAMMMGGGNTAQGGFETLYDKAVGDVLHGTAEESFEAIAMLKRLNLGAYRPANGAKYPGGKFGTSLQQIAQLVKADVGLQVAFADMGGWDTHVNQGGATGQLATRLREFSGAIAALYTDLGDRMTDVTILTMSEFGRSARQNGGGGTDHGHGTAFLALGGDVNGGKVLGKWPGLSPDKLYENRDLAVTTDFRSVFAEVATKHLRIPATGIPKLFPGYTGTAADFRGVIRG